MDKLIVLGFLVTATSLEATGDAIVRMGIAQNAWMPRSLLFVVGSILLFGYGAEYGRRAGTVPSN